MLLGFQPGRKRVFLLGDDEFFLARQLCLYQRIGAVLPFAAGLAKFKNQGQELTAHLAALLAARISALPGNIFCLLELGLRQFRRRRLALPAPLGIASRLLQRPLGLAFHIGRHAGLFEQQFKIPYGPVKFLKFALAQRPAEQTLVLEP